MKTSKAKRIAIALLSVALSAPSCSLQPLEDTSHKPDLGSVRVNLANPLYADFSSFDLAGGGPATKAATPDSPSAALTSLLDRGAAVSIADNAGVWTQTPIRETGQGSVYLSSSGAVAPASFSGTASTGRDELVVRGTSPGEPEASRVRKYLIESPTEYFVVTMVPYPGCSDGSWDYFRSEGFFGHIIYSTPEGRITGVENYHPMRGCAKAMPVSNPAEYSGIAEMDYINIILNTRSTTLDGGELDASVCIATSKTYQLMESWDEYISGNQSDGGRYGSTHSGGSAGGGRPSTLTARVEVAVSGGGKVYGTGTYGIGSYVRLIAVPDEDSNFLYWTGGLGGSDAVVLLKLEQDIAANAVFAKTGEKRPCYNAGQDSFFPVGGVAELAPTSSGGRAESGSYGDVRRNADGSVRPHRGWDILAAPGTPFYAPVGGTISGYMKSNVPNGTDDKGGYGNRIGITFSRNGHNYSVFFAHLNYTDKQNPGDDSNGIGVNPRTGKTWKKGDKVYPGELLGHTGDTGLAWNVDCKHLHIEVHTSASAWPAQGSSWDKYEEPSLLFGDVLTRDGSGRVSDVAMKVPCDELPKSDAQNFQINLGFSQDYPWTQMLFPGQTV